MASLAVVSLVSEVSTPWRDLYKHARVVVGRGAVSTLQRIAHTSGMAVIAVTTVMVEHL